MGGHGDSAADQLNIVEDQLLAEFARLMRKRHDAVVYLFGSRVRGTPGAESDYDLAAVSAAFAGEHWTARAPDRYRLWRQAGGQGISLDLHCYTPEEFRRELAGLGCLGQASDRGELLEVPTSRAA